MVIHLHHHKHVYTGVYTYTFCKCNSQICDGVRTWDVVTCPAWLYRHAEVEAVRGAPQELGVVSQVSAVCGKQSVGNEHKFILHLPKMTCSSFWKTEGKII